MRKSETTRLRANALAPLVVMGLMLLGPPNPETPVADAARSGDIASVETLLAAGADVNAPQGDGMTALHWAANRRDIALAQILIAAGGNVSAVTRLGAYTPLHLAAKAGTEAVVTALLESGAEVEAKTSSGGARALHLASASGDGATVHALLSAGADPNALDDAWGQTPLMFAASQNRTEAISELLAAGADVSIASRSVDITALAQTDRIAKQERNARIRAAGPGKATPTRSESAETPLTRRPPPVTPDVAERMAQAEDDQRQIEEPAPLSYGELVGGHGGLTALLHTTREGHRASTLALLNAGADINQTSVGDHTSPMLMAMINGHFDLAMELFERGADPSLASDGGNTPLYAAVNTHWAPKARYPQQHAYKKQETDYLAVMERLLKAGVDANARLSKHLWYMSYNFDLLQVNTEGATAFWRAAHATDVPAMRLLVAYGADPNLATVKVPARRRRNSASAEDHSGLEPIPVGGPAVYPIHASSGVGYGLGFAGNSHRHVPDSWIPAVRYMVEELGADVNTRDLHGYTPLHHAAARGDTELILYLMEVGGDITAVSRSGQSIADMANGPVQRVEPFPAAVALLESLGSVNNHRCVSC